jgi:hypothetical protein
MIYMLSACDLVAVLLGSWARGDPVSPLLTLWQQALYFRFFIDIIELSTNGYTLHFVSSQGPTHVGQEFMMNSDFPMGSSKTLNHSRPLPRRSRLATAT